VHWWVQVHSGRILLHTGSFFFFSPHFWIFFTENFTNLAKIALEFFFPKNSPILSQKMAKFFQINKFDKVFKSKLRNHVIIRN
jgi:hypothetical protein